MKLNQATEPGVEPVTLDEVIIQCHVDSSDEKTLLENLIVAAREFCEEHTARAFISRKFTVHFDLFPCGSAEMFLPLAPLVSIDLFKYTNSSDVETTLVENTDFVVDNLNEPPRIKPVHGTTWPTDLKEGSYNKIEIEFTAGYGTAAADVPGRLRQAMLLLIGHWYKNREAIITGSISKEIEFSLTATLQHFCYRGF